MSHFCCFFKIWIFDSNLFELWNGFSEFHTNIWPWNFIRTSDWILPKPNLFLQLWPNWFFLSRSNSLHQCQSLQKLEQMVCHCSSKKCVGIISTPRKLTDQILMLKYFINSGQFNFLSLYFYLSGCYPGINYYHLLIQSSLENSNWYY